MPDDTRHLSLEEAQRRFPEATLREDWTTDLSVVLGRKLIDSRTRTVVWEQRVADAEEAH